MTDNTMNQPTNTAATTLLNGTQAATPAPPRSSPDFPAIVSSETHGLSSPFSINQSTKSPLRRAPSSSSLGGSDRSTTPILHKRASLSSLQGIGGIPLPRSPSFRRTSAHSASSPGSGFTVRSLLPPPLEKPQPTPATAASIAHESFEEELKTHQSGAGKAEEAQTIVVLQDDCYSHRFSRPRTSKANLNTIVERPERIHASILGLATAYVRLGGRYSDGDAPPHPHKNRSSLPSVPFKIHKTARRVSLKSPAVVAIHGIQWMNELSAMCDTAESKLALNGKELSRPNTLNQTNGKTQVDRPKLHEGDLYLCSESLNALEGALGAVCEGVDTVFNDRDQVRTFICIRPPGHHCSADMPSGFCWLNNVHIGISHAVLTHGLTHAAIIDFDLHHGDGSQSITWAHNSRIHSMAKNTPVTKKTAIGYFSLHDINSYPCELGDEEKVRNASLCIEDAHGQNIWNVHLQPWKTEAEFWQLYEEKYSVVLDKARIFLRTHSNRLRQAPTHPKPKAAIFLSAGFDASEWESPGMHRHQVNVPTDFYARLTRDVVSIAEEEGLGVDGRIISILEGGYSDRAIMSGVLSHLSGLATAGISSTASFPADGLGSEMDRRLGRLNLSLGSMPGPTNLQRQDAEIVDPSWWSVAQLEELEAIVKPPTPVPASKQQQYDARPTYTSATQSYTAKIVSPPQGRRSVSGSGGNLNQQGVSITRALSPPPPAVDWATAAHELSKLLIPSDRETKSCKPEDLNAETSRARRDRRSSVGLLAHEPAANTNKMRLRDRKARPQQYASDDDDSKPSTKTSRRKTIADVPLLIEEVEPSTALSENSSTVESSRPARRRSSVASTASSMTVDRGSDFSRGCVIDTEIERNQLSVKPSRAIANPRQGATKFRAFKKQTPVSYAPSVSSAASTSNINVVVDQETNKAPPVVSNEIKTKDVDELASGMKRMSIKLKMPAKYDYEAREVKPKAAPRGRALKSSVSKSTTPMPPTKAQVKARKAESLPKPLCHEVVNAQQFPQPALDSGRAQRTPEPVPEPKLPVQPLQPAAQIPLEQIPITPVPLNSFASIPVNNPVTATSVDPSAHILNVEQANIESPKAVSQSPTPQQLSSNLSAPGTPIAVKRTREALPTFTSTSPISFSKYEAKSHTVASNASQIANTDGHANDDPKVSGSPLVGG